MQRGKGWVCIIAEKIVGFAIVDLKEENIWALFIHPDFEKRGIEKLLHDQMLSWYFAQDKQRVWLGTAPNTLRKNFIGVLVGKKSAFMAKARSNLK